jgi:predicted dienelactone hydrolase
MSISDSIAPANKQERELSQGLLLDILETDSEDDIALKNLRKKLVADMKKEKVQGQSKVPALTKQDTDNLMEKLQRVESPPLKNNSHDQFDGISLSHFTLTKQMN